MPELEARFHAARRADRSGDLTRAWRAEIGDGSSDSRYVLVKHLWAPGFTGRSLRRVLCGVFVADGLGAGLDFGSLGIAVRLP